MRCKCYITFQYAIAVEEHGLVDGQLLSLPSQLLLDYNDLQKLPFYDMLDKALNRDGLRLRYAAQIQLSFFKKTFGFFLMDLMLSCGFKGLIPWGR